MRTQCERNANAMLMNYVEMHIGDYSAATFHLTALEDGIYWRLLRCYYRDERPLIGSADDVARMAGARTDDERSAVKAVLKEFFVSTDQGFTHNRCDAEIAHYQSKTDKAKTSANARWSHRRGKTDECERNANALPTQSERNAKAMLPNHQEPDPKQNLKGASPSIKPEGEVSAKKPADATPAVQQNPKPENQSQNRQQDATKLQCPVKKIMDAYNRICTSLTGARELTQKRLTYVTARWRAKAVDLEWKTQRDGIEFFERVFTSVEDSTFLTGRGKPRPGYESPFKADFDWLIEPSNFAKLMEGSYDD